MTQWLIRPHDCMCARRADKNDHGLWREKDPHGAARLH
jgi:hypothetical protein